MGGWAGKTVWGRGESLWGWIMGTCGVGVVTVGLPWGPRESVGLGWGMQIGGAGGSVGLGCWVQVTAPLTTAPQLMALGIVPMCSSQSERMFNTTRIPGKETGMVDMGHGDRGRTVVTGGTPTPAGHVRVPLSVGCL